VFPVVKNSLCVLGVLCVRYKKSPLAEARPPFSKGDLTEEKAAGLPALLKARADKRAIKGGGF